MERTNHRSRAAASSPRFNLVFGFACRCPAVEQPNCIFATQRGLSIAERYRWARSLSDAELERLYQAHHDCFLRQYAARLIPTRSA